MAVIGGWSSVRAFSESIKKAKELAVKEKKRQCRNDLEKWTWNACSEYYGASVMEIKEGTVTVEDAEV